MKTTVKKLTKEQSIIEVETNSGFKTLEINKTQSGHSYEDYAEWNITDEQYYKLEEFVDGIIKQMEGKDILDVTYDFSENLSLEELKEIANEYEKLISENAVLIHFKDIATKYLTKEQLSDIEEEMNDIPETN